MRIHTTWHEGIPEHANPVMYVCSESKEDDSYKSDYN
jgi:hypothetical protein